MLERRRLRDPGVRAPLSPAVPLLAAGSFLLGAMVVILQLADSVDDPLDAGVWLMAAGALATTVVATLLAVRRPPG